MTNGNLTSHRRQLLVRPSALILAFAFAAAACAGVTDDQATSVSNSVTSTTDDQAASVSNSVTAAADVDTTVTSSAGGVSFDRDSFVLCPVIEEHKDELAAIVGFEVDRERGVEAFFGECMINGVEGGDFARVQLARGPESTPAMYSERFEGPASPAPELGDDAVFIDDWDQPSVLFLLGGLIIDVDAALLYEGPPTRVAMITFAQRVAELLTDANS